MGICAYIDILGFKNFVNENPQGTLMVLQNYQVQLQFLDKFPNDNTYTAPYKTDSFNYLIPFSDSIFFYSEKPSEFVMQLSNFVNGSFSFTSDAFSNTEDPLHPENVTEKGAVVEDGKVVMKDFPAKLYDSIWYYDDERNLKNNESAKTKPIQTSLMHNCGVVNWGWSC